MRTSYVRAFLVARLQAVTLGKRWLLGWRYASLKSTGEKLNLEHNRGPGLFRHYGFSWRYIFCTKGYDV